MDLTCTDKDNLRVTIVYRYVGNQFSCCCYFTLCYVTAVFVVCCMLYDLNKKNHPDLHVILC